MNQMLEFLYLQVTEKLKDDGISINARNVLTDIKNELIEILKKELTLDDLDKTSVILESMKAKMKKLKEEESCLDSETKD